MRRNADRLAPSGDESFDDQGTSRQPTHPDSSEPAHPPQRESGPITPVSGPSSGRGPLDVLESTGGPRRTHLDSDSDGEEHYSGPVPPDAKPRDADDLLANARDPGASADRRDEPQRRREDGLTGSATGTVGGGGPEGHNPSPARAIESEATAHTRKPR